MAHIFISYARSDAQFVRRLTAALEGAGCSVWIDREDIPGGAKWAAEIVNAIETSSAVLVALSPRSMESAHVRREIAVAADASKLILPVLIEPTKVGAEARLHLADVQRIDFTVDFDSGLEQLLEAVRPILQGELDTIIADPDLTTQQKIQRYMKARAGQKDPIDVRLEAVRERKEKLESEIGALEREKQDLIADGVKPGSRTLKGVDDSLAGLERTRTALTTEYLALMAERSALFDKKTAELTQKADDLMEKYRRITDKILGKS